MGSLRLQGLRVVSQPTQISGSHLYRNSLHSQHTYGGWLSASSRVAVMVCALAAGTFGASSGSEQECNLKAGCVGRVHVGDSLADVEAVLGRKIELDFAGFDRYGFMVDAPSEIAKLSFHLPRRVHIEAADLFLVDSPQGKLVDMISLATSCEEVGALRRYSVAQGSQIKTTKSGWGSSASRNSASFAWGGDTHPVCRLWVRKASPQSARSPSRAK
jgi:hypothetical protein